MWLLPEQAARIFSECGLPAAPAGTAADMRLTLAVDPSEGRIALGAEPASGRDPGRCAAQEVQVDPRHGLWDGHVRELLAEKGIRCRRLLREAIKPALALAREGAAWASFSTGKRRRSSRG